MSTDSQTPFTRPVTHLETLLGLASGLEPFSSDHGQAYIGLPAGESPQFWPVRSARFRDWLLAAFYNTRGELPTDSSLRRAISAIESLAHANTSFRRSVERRVAANGNPHLPECISLDLDNQGSNAIEITAEGWAAGDGLRHGFRHAFRHSRGNLALPVPLHDCAPSALARLFRVAPGPNLTLLQAWLSAALRPTGPYPILVLTGPPGSGKSVAAAMLRNLVDPSTAPLQALPNTPAALLREAWHNWLLAFDDVHHISDSMSSALCRLSSGTGYLLNERAAEREALRLKLARPIVITTTESAARLVRNAVDNPFLSRVITVHMEAIPPTERKTEESLWTRFDSLHPALLGLLCDATSMAMRNYSTVKLPGLPRHADFTVWAVAAAPAFGYSVNTLVNALVAPTLDPIRGALHHFLAGRPSWTGTATELWDKLESQLGKHQIPASPRGLSQLLNKLGGVTVERHRLAGGLTRLMTVTLTLALATQPTPRHEFARIAA